MKFPIFPEFSAKRYNAHHCSKVDLKTNLRQANLKKKKLLNNILQQSNIIIICFTSIDCVKHIRIT